VSFFRELRRAYRRESPAPPKPEVPNVQAEAPIIVPEFPYLTGRCAHLCGFGKIDRNRSRYQHFEEMYRDAIQGDNISLAKKCSIVEQGYMCPGLAWVIAVNRLLVSPNQQQNQS